jgi:hypothetical protein
MTLLAQYYVAHTICCVMAGEHVSDLQLLTAVDRASKSAAGTKTHAVLQLMQRLVNATVRRDMAEALQ